MANKNNNKTEPNVEKTEFSHTADKEYELVPPLWKPVGGVP